MDCAHQGEGSKVQSVLLGADTRPGSGVSKRTAQNKYFFASSAPPCADLASSAFGQGEALGGVYGIAVIGGMFQEPCSTWRLPFDPKCLHLQFK
eukprot:2419276-Amphidinium_carterae.2